MDEHAETPTTIREVGIHIGYMREELKDLNIAIQDMAKNHASIKDLADLDARVLILEKRNIIKNTLVWVSLVASTLIAVISSYQLFTGGK